MGPGVDGRIDPAFAIGRGQNTGPVRVFEVVVPEKFDISFSEGV